MYIHPKRSNNKPASTGAVLHVACNSVPVRLNAASTQEGGEGRAHPSFTLVTRRPGRQRVTALSAYHCLPRQMDAHMTPVMCNNCTDTQAGPTIAKVSVIVSLCFIRHQHFNTEKWGTKVWGGKANIA